MKLPLAHKLWTVVFTLGLLLNGCQVMPSALLPAPSATPAPSTSPTARPSATVTATSAPTATASATAFPSPAALPLEPTPTLPALTAEERSTIFAEVWGLVRDRYVYEDYRGVDWEAVRAELAPQAAAARSPAAFYDVMRDMIDRLGDDHSRFESPQEVAEREREFEGELNYGGIGAVIRDIPEGGLVIAIAPNSPAARAGLRPRDLVLAVETIPFTDTEAFGPAGPIGRVRGEPGTPVTITVRSGDGPARDVTLIRQVIPGDAFPRVEASRIGDGRIGLVRIDTFYVEDVDTKVRAAVEKLIAAGPLDGLVIDVRSNGGGFVHLMQNTLALFIDGGNFGSTGGRNESEEQIVPSGQTITTTNGIPIAVLIGPDTASAAEMFAAGMQVLGRGRLVGLPTAGNTENLYSYSFDDGSRLMLAEVTFKLPDGTMIEGRGVLPDRAVEVDWWRFPIEQDPQILAALREIATLRQADGN